jgi:hypothetical protein
VLCLARSAVADWSVLLSSVAPQEEFRRQEDQLLEGTLGVAMADEAEEPTTVSAKYNEYLCNQVN